MKKILKFFIYLTCITSCLLNAPISIYADIHTNYTSNINPIRDDEIITIYKEINGLNYKRRWNVSKECWVDSDWIPCS